MIPKKTSGRRSALLARRTAALVSLAGIVALGSVAGAHAAGQITGRQIKDNTVSGRDIRNGSLWSTELAVGTLRAWDFVEDPTGPPGAVGLPGPDGPGGRAGFRGVEYAFGDTAEVTGFETVTATCSGSEKVIGGGAQTVGGTLTAIVSTSFPTADGHSWVTTLYQAEAQNGGHSTVEPWALCATVD